MANSSILAAFETIWQHTVVALGNKVDRDEMNTAIDSAIEAAFANIARAEGAEF